MFFIVGFAEFLLMLLQVAHEQGDNNHIAFKLPGVSVTFNVFVLRRKVNVAYYHLTIC